MIINQMDFSLSFFFFHLYKYLESIGGSRVGAAVIIDELVNAGIIMCQC